MNYTATFPKTDSRHWPKKLVTRGSDELHVRICFGGVQRWWPLKTTNREQAAIKARDIWNSLVKDGFEVTQAKFKPWTVEPEAKDGTELTVGEFIKSVKAVSTARPTTFTTYERKFRFLVSQIARVKGTRKRHDYFHKGHEKWREKIDAVALAELTPQAVAEWQVRYVSRFDAKPMKRQQAQQSAASILRNSKALFSPKILKRLAVNLPSPLPFDGFDMGKRPRTRYKSSINAGALVAAANAELKQSEPEQFKIFLLAFGAGLRRGEIDRLTWKQFNWDTGRLSIEANEYGISKTESSNEEIDLGPEMIEYFKSTMESAKGDFVVTSKAAPTAAPHWNRYRCDGHFKGIIEWLGNKGVTARNPLHTLRKEFGSLINKKFGIFAASAALRHSNINLTREVYVDKKQRTALSFAEL